VPRVERLDRASGTLDIGGAGHYGLSSKVGERTQRRISADCASPPVG
jgi:hypothetical protein